MRSNTKGRKGKKQRGRGARRQEKRKRREKVGKGKEKKGKGGSKRKGKGKIRTEARDEEKAGGRQDGREHPNFCKSLEGIKSLCYAGNRAGREEVISQRCWQEDAQKGRKS